MASEAAAAKKSNWLKIIIFVDCRQSLSNHFNIKEKFPPAEARIKLL